MPRFGHALALVTLTALLPFVPTPAAHAADDAPIPLEAFATLGALRQIQLSPDGTHIAYLFPAKGRQVVLAHPIDDASDPTVLPLGEGAFVRWFAWINDERIAVAYQFSETVRNYGQVQLVGGADIEQTRLRAFKRDGSDVRRPVRLVQPDKSDCDSAGGSRLRADCPEPFYQDNVIDWMPDDPDHILIEVDAMFAGTVTGGNNTVDVVRKVNVKSGNYQVVRTGRNDIQSWVTDQDHQVRFGIGRNQKRERVALYRQPDGEWVELNDAPWIQAGIVPVHFESDPRYAIGTGRVNGETRAIVRLDMVEGTVLEVLHEDDQYDLFPKFQDNDLIGYVIPARDNELVLTDPAWQKMYEAVGDALPEYNVSLLDWTADKKMVLIRASNERDEGTVYVWDRNVSKIFALGRIYPDLDPARMAPMEQVSYQARDGLEITAYLSVPPGAKRNRLPVVVMPHGGPSSRDTLAFDFLVQMIASRGYAVLQPNFRGSLYQGRSFEEAGKGEWGRKMQDDLTDAVKWLVDEGIADQRKVCIVGWSYGGYAALMGAAQTPDMYQCAASINGVTDLKLLRGRYSYSRTALRQVNEFIGADGVDLSDFSPVDLADSIRIPVLIVHARDDGRVPFDHGESMAKALKRSKRDVTFVPVEAGDHALRSGAARLQMLEALEGFLREHLGRGA